VLHRHRRALRKIEEELAAADPGLAQILSKDRPPVQTRIWRERQRGRRHRWRYRLLVRQ
jgi:uncharacterized membrane protein YccC